MPKVVHSDLGKAVASSSVLSSELAEFGCMGRPLQLVKTSPECFHGEGARLRPTLSHSVNKGPPDVWTEDQGERNRATDLSDRGGPGSHILHLADCGVPLWMKVIAKHLD